MKKHQQRKLQLVTTTTCASGMFATAERKERARFVGWPMGPHTSCTDCCIVLVISAWSVVVVVVVVECCCCISYRLALMPALLQLVQTFHLQRWWLSPVASGMFATAERKERARFVGWPMGPHTSCTDCCIVLVISAWSVVVVVVVVECCCCISYRLALMPALLQLVQTFHLQRWWLSPVATCTGGAFSFHHWRHVVVVSGGGM